jgi:glycosyltransferase involved in cell wall biosynthesis
VETHRIGFLVSQNLGHAVHGQRLRRELSKYPDIEPAWMPILAWAPDLWQHLPVIKSNLTLLSGLRSRDQLRHQSGQFDALYCHTQEAAVLLGPYMKRIPTVLSLDATPINMDSIGEAYDHGQRSRPVERAKHLLTRRAFHRAAHLVTFSSWAKNSLINDYGVPEARVTVNTPGVDLTLWHRSDARQIDVSNQWTPRILFVGGDFRRKGGATLVKCATEMQGECTVDIVTNQPVNEADGVSNLRIYRSVKADSPELLALYRGADIFALPTTGDCLVLAIIEAMAMSLPVVTTSVGGVAEVVVHGETGLLIPPDSPGTLIEAIRFLRSDPARCRAMGEAGRLRVQRHFDGTQSYRRLVELIRHIAAGDGAS